MNKLIILICVGLFSFGAMAADINAGKEKSAMCIGCHGVAGISAIPMYPNLAGQKDLYLVKQLRAFRDGERKDPTMSAMAKALSDSDIENVAAFYATLK